MRRYYIHTPPHHQAIIAFLDGHGGWNSSSMSSSNYNFNIGEVESSFMSVPLAQSISQETVRTPPPPPVQTTTALQLLDEVSQQQQCQRNERTKFKEFFIFSSSRRTARKGSAPGLSYSKIIVYYEMNMYIHTYKYKHINAVHTYMYVHKGYV